MGLGGACLSTGNFNNLCNNSQGSAIAMVVLGVIIFIITFVCLLKICKKCIIETANMTITH